MGHANEQSAGLNGRFRKRAHDDLGDGVIVQFARFGQASRLACGVDDDHCDRQAEVLHHLGGCVLHHCGEYLGGIWFEEAGGALHPGKRRISRPAVFPESSGEPDVDLVVSLAREKKDAAFAHYLPVDEGSARHHCCAQVVCNKRFVRTPLTGDQSYSGFWQQVLHQPFACTGWINLAMPDQMPGVTERSAIILLAFALLPCATTSLPATTSTTTATATASTTTTATTAAAAATISTTNTLPAIALLSCTA